MKHKLESRLLGEILQSMGSQRVRHNWELNWLTDLPNMYNLNPAVRKHHVNLKWGKLHEITGLYSSKEATVWILHEITDLKLGKGNGNPLHWKIPWTGEPGRLQSMGLQRVGHDWATFSLSLSLSLSLKIGKGVWQCCMLSLCIFNLYTEDIIRNAGLDESQARIKVSGRNINNLRYTNNTTLMAES